MIFKGLLTIGTAVAVSILGGCRSDANDGPPDIRLGDSVCAECGMIISDERFATATVVVGDRGNEPLVFDDFNCQIIFESKHGDLSIVDRWSRDHGTLVWLHTVDAWFVRSSQLRTPMASGMAVFASKADAEAFAEPIEGDVLEFDAAWKND